MAEWAENLKQDREYDSDEAIEYLISLRQIDDQIQDTLFTGSAHETNLEDARTLIHMRFMAAQLESWKKNSAAAMSRRVLELSSSFTDIALLSALEAGKRFLDTLFTLSAQEYHLVSFCECTRLPLVIRTIAQLCVSKPAHIATGWDFKAAQYRTRLDLCLESICYRMKSLSTYDKVSQPHSDFWHTIRNSIDLTRTWYVRKITPADLSPSRSTPNGLAGRDTSEASGSSSQVVTTPVTHQAKQSYDSLGSIDYMQNTMMDVQVDTGEAYEPLVAMKHADFDMEQFPDMGIWGEQIYVGMGFGDNEMPF
ncbi:hypothetical protein NX059_004967 [Plenodomus lindquistii]|nr:hypothetical protein NX059_004967 [Plenodomus lindquistii]